MIRKREAFEYALVKQQKQIKDYLAYIKYETNLMKLVVERQRERNSELKLELSIIKKIKGLYRLAITRFPSRERLWEGCIDFFIRNGSEAGEIRALFTQMLQFHADNAQCWMRAIRWEREHNTERQRDMDVRNLLMQGLRRHPICTAMCVELLNIILTNDSVAEEVRINQALCTFRLCVKTNTSIECYVAMLEEATLHSFAGHLQSTILRAMRTTHVMEPQFWHVLAQRELNGQLTFPDHTEDNDDVDAGQEVPATAAAAAPGTIQPSATTSEATTLRADSIRSRIERCMQVYEAGVVELNNTAMWSYYLDAMVMLNRDANAKQLPLRRRMLGRAFKRGDAASRLSLEHYLRYVEILYEMNADADVIEQILARAVRQHNATPMWLAYMRHHIRASDEVRARHVLEEGRKRLDDVAAQPLWELYINMLLCDPVTNGQEIRELYRQITLKLSPVYSGLKVNYVEFVFRHADGSGLGDIERVRAMMQRLKFECLPCYEMLIKLAELESWQLKPNLAEWRNALQSATHHFGRERTDVWMRLIQFEAKHGNPLVVSKVSEEAKHKLDKKLLDAFIAECDMWQLGMSTISIG